MNKSDYKKYKGQLIRLTYNGNHNNKIQTGKITALTTDHILFKINNEMEISIKFDKIIGIELIKTFSHYIRTVNRNISESKPQNAIYILDTIRDTFKLDYQLTSIEKLRKQCVDMIWKLNKK